MMVRRIGTALLLLGCLSVAGCFNIGPFGRPAVRFTGEGGQTQLMQRFAEGWGSQAGDGVYDIVLVSEGERSTGVNKRPGAVLVPGRSVPVRQVVHMRVHWRPARGAKANSPAATNMSMHWYLYGEGEEGGKRTDYLQYDGSGFVKVWAADKGRTFKVRIINAKLEAGEQAGELNDVLGETAVGGYFKVKVNPDRVRNLLADVGAARGAVAGARD